MYEVKESKIEIKDSLCKDFIASLHDSKIQKYEVIFPVYNLVQNKFKSHKTIKFYQDSKKIESVFGSDEISKILLGKHLGHYIGIEFMSFFFHFLGAEKLHCVV